MESGSYPNLNKIHTNEHIRPLWFPCLIPVSLTGFHIQIILLVFFVGQLICILLFKKSYAATST